MLLMMHFKIEFIESLVETNTTILVTQQQQQNFSSTKKMILFYTPFFDKVSITSTFYTSFFCKYPFTKKIAKPKRN